MKFAFLGPESTGKTTTARLIADKIDGIYIPEVARDYLIEKKLNYTYEDIIDIAKQQYQLELTKTDKYPDKIIVCDTELITIEIWLEYYNYQIPSWISDAIIQSNYTLYLLFDIDIAWKADELRANEQDRTQILQSFIKKLNQYNKPWRIVNGQGEMRVENVEVSIRSFL